MHSQKVQTLIFWGIALISICILVVAYFGNVEEKRSEEALKAYKEGEQAQSLAQRQEAFNKALTLYKQLAADYPTSYGTGVLDYNIANSYFELEQYPSAVLYYHKALKLNPWNDLAYHNLQVALGKLKLSQKPDSPWWKRLLSLDLGLAISQKFQLFFFASLVACILGSIFIWKGIPQFKRYAWIAAAFASVLLISIFIGIYVEPMEAIVLRSVILYRDAGKQYAKVQEEPLPEGMKLEILGLAEEGRWIKVRTPDGTLGFVPVDRIGII